MPPAPSACRDRLRLPAGLDGTVWLHHGRGDRPLFHCHDELEFNLCLAGAAAYELAGGRTGLAPGSLIWFHPDQVHRLVEQAGFSMWVVVFRRRAHARWPALVGPAAARHLAAADPPGHPCRRLLDEDAHDLDRALHAVASLTAAPAAHRTGLDFILALAWRAFQRAAVPAAAPHPAVAAAYAELQRDPGVAGAELAARVGLSRARLSRYFHAQLGETLVDCRLRLRLERFLAAPPPRPGGLLAAALAAGFGSYAQFHRAFRRRTGEGPRAWLRRQPPPHYG